MEKIGEQPKTSGPYSAIDSPCANERVYDQSISIAGWMLAEELPQSQEAQCVRAYIDNICVGETRIFTRENSHDNRLAFKILARISEPIIASCPAVISIWVSREGENTAQKLGEPAGPIAAGAFGGAALR